MSVDQDGFAQVTDEVRLQGDGVQVAKQFRDRVMHPVLQRIHEDQGGKEVMAFVTCILLQCALDIRAMAGVEMAEAALTEVRNELAKTSTAGQAH